MQGMIPRENDADKGLNSISPELMREIYACLDIGSEGFIELLAAMRTCSTYDGAYYDEGLPKMKIARINKLLKTLDEEWPGLNTEDVKDE